ncbi:MAG: MFS transporter, partial [Anaerolineae bacterium]|nr:MFS transporter [Anaerolineae bacterium]
MPSLRFLLQRTGYPPMVFRAMGGGFAYALSLTLIVAPLPHRIQGLGGSLVAVGTAATLFGLSSSFFRPVAGRLVDWQAGPMYLVGVAIMAGVPLVYAFVPSLGAIYAARLVHGLALSLASTAYRTIVASLAPEDRRGEGMALGGLTYPLALMVAPAAGESLAGAWGLEATFVVAAALGMVALAVVWPLREVGRGPTRAGGLPRVGMWGLLRQRGLLLSCAASVVTGIVFATLAAFVPLLGAELALPQTGLFFTVFSALVLLLRVPAGRLSDRVGRAPVLVASGLLMTASCGAMTVARGPAAALALAAATAVAYVGLRSPSEALVADATPRHRRGTGLALNFLAFDLGSSAGPLMMGAVAEGMGLGAAFLA